MPLRIGFDMDRVLADFSLSIQGSGRERPIAGQIKLWAQLGRSLTAVPHVL